MNRAVVIFRRFVAAALIIFLYPLVSSSQPPLNKDWKYDTVRMKNGYLCKGLILEETLGGIRFQHVHRALGRPTVSMTMTLPRAEIEQVNKLPNEERDQLKHRLKELDPTGEGERKRMETLELQVCDWNGKPKAGKRYDSDFFSLVSNAPDEVIQRTAVRLEQIYTAYEHLLPPRFPGGQATTIMLYPSIEEYQKMLKSRGWELQNTAFFNPQTNRIFCGSNLVELGNDLEQVRADHQKGRAILDAFEAEMRRLYGKKPAELALRLTPVRENRKEMAATDRYNDAIFDKATKRLLEILYHESFHAYVSNFVYPKPVPDAALNGRPGELPRWLNEGLAQIFETAIVEAGELRVGHADRERLARVKEQIKKDEMMPLKDLLNAGQKAFLVHNANDRLASDRAYLASWSLAAYLSFDRRLLGSPKMDAFVRAINRGEKPEDALAALTGQKLPQFEKEFHAWLEKIPLGGSMLEVASTKD